MMDRIELIGAPVAFGMEEKSWLDMPAKLSSNCFIESCMSLESPSSCVERTPCTFLAKTLVEPAPGITT
jgi:hypothetical protein